MTQTDKHIDEYSQMTAIEKLSYFRNLYYTEGNQTENGIIAKAINDMLPQMIVLSSRPIQTVWFINSHFENREGKRTLVSFVDKGIIERIVIGDKGIQQIEVCNNNNERLTFDAEDDFDRYLFNNYKSANKALNAKK